MKARKFDLYGLLPYAPILQHVQEIEDSRTPELDPETHEAFDRLFANFDFESIKSILACSLSNEPDTESLPGVETPEESANEPTLLEVGALASEYMPAYLKQIAEANKTALPRDPAKEAFSAELPHTAYHSFNALGKETRRYAHWLASQGRQEEASAAILTVLDLLKFARFGTNLNTLCPFVAGYFWHHGSMPMKLEEAMASELILDPATGESFAYEQLNRYSFRLRSNGPPGLFPAALLAITPRLHRWVPGEEPPRAASKYPTGLRANRG
ncbi:MAG: hypothetical protein ACK4P3_04800 [Fimbriimonadaceae bacterium]